jgi:hypothetical protein
MAANHGLLPPVATFTAMAKTVPAAATTRLAMVKSPNRHHRRDLDHAEYVLKLQRD